MEFVLYPMLGVFSGIMAGLFGIGGGVVIVPILIVVFTKLGFHPSFLMHTAIGTSFAAIAFSAFWSAYSHHLLGNVNWQLFFRMLAGLIVGVSAGSYLAALIDGSVLKAIVIVFFAVIALQLLLDIEYPQRTEERGVMFFLFFGVLIGGMSAFFGIGGGSMSVPFFHYVGEPMKRAIATSAACGLPIAIAGAISYAVLGEQFISVDASNQVQTLHYATGYIYWPACLGIALFSAPAAKYAAQWSTILPEKQLKSMFAILLLLVCAYMILA